MSALSIVNQVDEFLVDGSLIRTLRQKGAREYCRLIRIKSQDLCKEDERWSIELNDAESAEMLVLYNVLRQNRNFAALENIAKTAARLCEEHGVDCGGWEKLISYE